jgi:hypothetical protein
LNGALMTSRAPAWSLFADAGSFSSYPTVTAPFVKITANRQHVDRRFPVLGFTIDTGRLPYFEVLLTTDRKLFDPAHASARTSATFYASRQDAGLQRADDGNAIWLAPSGTIRAFASAGRVYYTAIAYADERGTNPVLAQPLSELASDAPFVSLSSDLASSQALSTILGVPLHRLSRGGTTSLSYPTSAPELRAEEDAVEGEDGYGASSLLQAAEIEENEEEEQALAAAYDFNDDDDEDGEPESSAFDDFTALEDDGGEIPEQTDDYDDGFDGPVEREAVTQETMAPASSRAYAGRGGYHDEADDAPPIDTPRALGATFPAGAPMPDMLSDAEDEEEPDDGAYDRAYDADEDDESFALDAAPEFESLEASGVVPRALEVSDMRELVRLVAPHESGSHGYAAINADGEFEGAFGHDHPAYHKWHVGLSYGIVQFTQDSGSLGRLLTAMRDRDTAQFRAVFGSDADELVRVTNLAGPSSSGVSSGRSTRVQPIAGADIWKQPWRARFEKAAQHVPFQAAQNQLAAELFLQPMLPFARWLGLDTQRALAIVFDRAVQMGCAGARRWIIEAVGPVQTPAQRQSALSALGYADVTSFQRATPGLDVEGEWGPVTHAAMVAALRALGDRSPLPIPTREQMLDAIERRASTTPWAKRVRELRRVTSISDEPFTF